MAEHTIRAFVPAADGFSVESVGGNVCLVQALDRTPATPPGNASTHTVCQSWAEEATEGPVVFVRCFTPQVHPIECCGHGLLAVAHIWLRRLQRDLLVLSMHQSTVHCWRSDGLTWLRFRRESVVAATVPAWTAAVFPQQPQPVAAATCGGERGYLVLQWPDDCDLRDLSPPGRGLTQWSQRAVICTAAQPASGNAAITLRYFAPQYGVPEDAATGSAVRVLADYWSHRFNTLSAVQCSPEGGLLMTRLAPDHVEVGGYCIPTGEVANDA